MKHPSHEFLTAIANGEKPSIQTLDGINWVDIQRDDGLLCVYNGMKVRIKPVPAPDVYRYINCYETPENAGFSVAGHYTPGSASQFVARTPRYWIGTIRVTVDGETGRLKSAEVFHT